MAFVKTVTAVCGNDGASWIGASYTTADVLFDVGERYAVVDGKGTVDSV